MSLLCVVSLSFTLFFFFFNDTATTEIYTLSLHDALPISVAAARTGRSGRRVVVALPGGELEIDWRPDDRVLMTGDAVEVFEGRSEEHTSELQSQSNLVCRLLLEKKKKRI